MLNRSLFSILTMMGLLFIVGCGDDPPSTPSSASEPLRVPLPSAVAVASTRMACRAVLSSLIYQRTEDVIAGEQGLSALVAESTDNIAVEVHTDRLSFMTQAAVLGGSTAGDDYAIVRNEPDYLIAVTHAEGGLAQTVGSVDTFLLNKRNGLAAWTRSRSAFLSEIPDTQSLYLVCR